MILGFKPQFKQPILNGTKIHTIREDKTNRWKVGKEIHFATGVRTKQYECFKQGICKGVQTIELQYFDKHCSDLHYQIVVDGIVRKFEIFINGFPADWRKIGLLVKNDGFATKEDFFRWFNKDFIGKIIHWTDYKYFKL